MTALYIVAQIRPRPEQQDQARLAYSRLAQISRAEDGCLLYDLVEGLGDEWLMLEKWADKESWDRHMASAHVAEIQDLEETLTVSSPVLNFYESAEKLPTER